MTRPVVSQGGPGDAAVNFDRPITFYNGIARFLCHSPQHSFPV